METQPPEDTSALAQKLTDLQADVAEIKELLKNLTLTQKPNYRYYDGRNSPEATRNPSKDSRAIAKTDHKRAGKPWEIPYVDEGDQATCTRCGHTWVPFVRQPKQCPACRQTWYKPKAWKRSTTLTG